MTAIHLPRALHDRDAHKVDVIGCLCMLFIFILALLLFVSSVSSRPRHSNQTKANPENDAVHVNGKSDTLPPADKAGEHSASRGVEAGANADANETRSGEQKAGVSAFVTAVVTAEHPPMRPHNELLDNANTAESNDDTQVPLQVRIDAMLAKLRLLYYLMNAQQALKSTTEDP